MNEKWKNIKIENLLNEYQISDYGNIKRVKINKLCYGKPYVIEKEKTLKPFDNGNGYKVISLVVKDGEKRKRKNFYIHRLVAQAFIPNPQNKPEVNHLNYDRGDNRAVNLEWTTDAENTNYSKFNMRHPRKKISGIRYKQNKYEVEVSHGGKLHYCGRYKKYEDAIKARITKLKELGVNEQYY